MKHLIQSCKGKDNCLEYCPCDCHKKQSELYGGIVQALAERERCLTIIEQYLKHSTHNPEDTCLENIIQEIKNV